ncbi:MAG: SLBB domain-containing protein [Spirochaetia bacterium]|jgi:protein involved in polysaccharide export with SLBB domain|nr:SLBB domain-containing protein [Spirochaetia bacterium]
MLKKNMFFARAFTVAAIMVSLTLQYAFAAADVATEGFIVKSTHLSAVADMLPSASPSPSGIQSFADQLSIQPPMQVDAASLMANEVLQAISSGYYPITPGDTFSLVYLDGSQQVQFKLQVGSDYKVVIPGLGNLNAKGLELPQFINQISQLVLNYHSYSNPQITLVGVGQFTVKVTSAVGGTTYVSAWGLSRLSQLVRNSSPYADSRDISVIDAVGKETHYDLYRGLRRGMAGQDPLISCGDSIRLGKAKVLVTLSGAVLEPGTYQLKQGDTVAQLLDGNYGSALAAEADKSAIRIERYNSKTASYDLIVCKADDALQLQDMDRITVSKVLPNFGTVSVVGAVSVSDKITDSNATTAILATTSGQLLYQLYPGDTVREMIEAISSRLLSSADLSSCYLVRGGKKTEIDVLSLLSDKSAKDNLQVKDGDQFFIPFNNKFVAVQGAVTDGGVFAYLPGKDAQYYINLAGGKTQDATGHVDVIDKNGRHISTKSEVPAQATIKVEKSLLNRNLALVATTIGIVSTIVNIVYYAHETIK